MICVSLAETEAQKLVQHMGAVSEQADLIEIRLDALKNFSGLKIQEILNATHLPVIVTNRSATEGGHFQGTEEARINLLLQAIDAGASHVDIELGTDTELRNTLIRHAQKAGTKTIVSFHDFHSTPDINTLTQILTHAIEAGADIPKIVTTACSLADVKKLLSLYNLVQDQSLIAFCMGPCGKISRVACLALGAYLTFASPSAGKETAAGQIPLEDMKSILNILLDPESKELCKKY